MEIKACQISSLKGSRYRSFTRDYSISHRKEDTVIFEKNIIFRQQLYKSRQDGVITTSRNRVVGDLHSRWAVASLATATPGGEGSLAASPRCCWVGKVLPDHVLWPEMAVRLCLRSKSDINIRTHTHTYITSPLYSKKGRAEHMTKPLRFQVSLSLLA